MTARLESPSDEMKRLFRRAAGKATAGEKDSQLMARAARRLNSDLPKERQIGARRSRAYWYAEIADVPSDHMDRVRELAFTLPLQEAQDAVEAAEQFIRDLREALLDRVLGGARGDAGDGGPVDPACDRRAAEGGEGGGHRRAPTLPAPVLRLITSSSP